MILKSSIEKLMRGENLKGVVCQQALDEMLDPAINPLQIAAFLVLLRAKQETSDELLGFCKANEYFVPKFQVNIDPDKIIDLSGTGGDKIKTPNISTIASFIISSKNIYTGNCKNQREKNKKSGNYK